MLIFVILDLRRHPDRSSARWPSRCSSSASATRLGGPTGYAINPARDLGSAHRARHPADQGQGLDRTGATPGCRSSARSSAAIIADSAVQGHRLRRPDRRRQGRGPVTAPHPRHRSRVPTPPTRRNQHERTVRRRDRPGHHVHPVHDLQPRRPGRRVDQKEHEQIFPRAGWVEHDAEEIWDNTREVTAGALAKADLSARTSPPSASPTSARPRWSGTGRPASRSTTRSSGRTPAPTDRQAARRARRRRRPVQGQGRPAAGHLLLRPEGPLDPRQRRRRPGEGRGRRPGVRQHGHLGASGT